VPVTVRRSRGPDTSAACGQLKGRTSDSRRKELSVVSNPSSVSEGIREPNTDN
jgi:hypothetical protein